MTSNYQDVSISSVAQALSTDYFCIYYVNTETDRFVEYSASEEYRKLGLARSGDDYIEFSRKSYEERIYPDDREMFLETFTKENVLASLAEHSTFTMTYRFMMGVHPVYVHLKATRLEVQDDHHIVIGISDIDEQMKAKDAFEKAHHASITYSRIAQALAEDYLCIYYVDMTDNHFVEYSSDDEYKRLGIEKTGTDFFGISRKNIRRIVYEEDQGAFLAVFTKENIQGVLDKHRSFTLSYRLMMNGMPVYVSLKATRMKDDDGNHIIIGINNIDRQMKRESEYQKSLEEMRSKAKNDFLTNMSHDIRTPMNAIVGYTNIASSHLDDTRIVKDSLGKISSASHFLLSLINDILDISKIENGQMQLSTGYCDLLGVFRRIQDITSLQAASKSLQISYQKESVKHFHVYADELRIEQILINIISNAIKYTPEGKSIDIIVEETELEGKKNQYRFVIRDTGIGISEEYLPYIFESFSREEKTTINQVQGAGLGLAITAKAVELMGGTISVKSRPGEGSEFTVNLDLEAIEEETETGSPEKDYHLEGRHVLVVEDNDINAEIVGMILEQYGMIVDRAENGRKSLERLGEAGVGYYSVVLMDIQMPVMDGYEATRAIRSLEEEYYRKIPVIAVSANAYDEDVRNALKSGMDAHLGKPFDPEELIRLICKYLKE